eukprot:467942_1
MNSQDIISLGVISWIAVCFIITLAITLKTMHQLCFKDSSEWINPTYRNLTIIVMVSFTCSSMTDLIHMILRWFIFTAPKTYTLELMIVCFAAGLYFVGDLIFYILILLRIYVPFQVNKCIIYCLLFIIVTSFIFSIFYCICIFYWATIPLWYWEAIRIALSVDDMILNLVILILFVHKMRKTVNNIDLSVITKDIERTVHVLSNVVAKHSLLFGIAVIINQGFFLLGVYVTVDRSIFFDAILQMRLLYSIRGLENVINTFVLWLILQANYNKYICLCKWCHIGISKCCFKNIDTVLQNPYQKL